MGKVTERRECRNMGLSKDAYERKERYAENRFSENFTLAVKKGMPEEWEDGLLALTSLRHKIHSADRSALFNSERSDNLFSLVNQIDQALSESKMPESELLRLIEVGASCFNHYC